MIPPDSLYLIPGPTKISSYALESYSKQLGSPDLDEDFWTDYFQLERHLQCFLGTGSKIAIQSGEGMLGLWGAMKSLIQPGDKVVSVVNGVFGEGFANMATSLGANVYCVEGSWRKKCDNDLIIDAIRQHNPSLVTMVHCETPTGLLNSLEGVGKAIHKYTNNGLFLVDFVSSAFGAPLDVDKDHIDIGLLAPQKVLSGPAALAFTSVSERAWLRIERRAYQGYDALLPFHNLNSSSSHSLPYTHNWHAIRASIAACQCINENGGVSKSVQIHKDVSKLCQDQLVQLNLKMYCDPSSRSPTVTAVEIPHGYSWREIDSELRKRNTYMAGSFGQVGGKVFRIGHMGTQADKRLVTSAIQVLADVLRKIR